MVVPSRVNEYPWDRESRELPVMSWWYHGIVKYRLYHIPFWLAYHYTWWALTIGDPRIAAINILFSPYSIKFWFYLIFEAIGAYFNLYFLIPRFLEKGNYVPYIVSLLCTILVTAMVIVPGYYITSYWSGIPFQQLFGETSYFDLFAKNALPSAVASMTLAMSIKLTKNWVQTRRREQLLEKEKLETELKFLRSQFNPHFLFNTINSIFFLINKNPAMASSSLAKFSDLLRYQLYECNEVRISLASEITCLENFMELEKLRSENLELNVDIDPQPKDHLSIAPFMLMTFTENAFKHVSRHEDQPNWITVSLETTASQLHFRISNSIATSKANPVVNYGGIGLQNVKRRLDLMYSGQYQLNIHHDAQAFYVTLDLNLAVDALLNNSTQTPA